MEKWIRRSGQGALWLIAATLLTKLIGVLQKIPLQNLGGDAVFGIYNMVYPLYQLMLVLAISGIPTIISIVIVQGEEQHRKAIARYFNHMMLVIGIVFGVMMFSLAVPIAQLLGEVQLAMMIRIIAVTLCFAPILASYRGYYQAIRLASFSSLSQLIEQVIRVLIMIAILYIGIAQLWRDIAIATYVMWGGAVGSLLSLLFLMILNKADSRKIKIGLSAAQRRHTLRLFVLRGIPAALAAVIVPFIAVLDSLTVPSLLKPIATFNMIAEQFGLYSRIQPLTQLVTMLLASTIAGAIPNLVRQQAGSRKLGRQQNVQHLLYYTFVIGAAASIGLYCLAEPISIMLYKDALAIGWFQLLALTTLPASVLAVIAPMLLLEGKLKRLIAMVLAAVLLKLALNIVLVSMTGSMLGAVYATMTALYGAMAVALYERGWLENLSKQGVKKASQTLVALFIMLTVLVGLTLGAEELLLILTRTRAVVSLYVIILVGIGALSLLICLHYFKLIDKKELKQLIK